MVTTTDKPVKPDLIACEVCLKEVPVSEASSAEATEYFVHFCGLECFQKWQQKRPGGTGAEPSKPPT